MGRSTVVVATLAGALLATSAAMAALIGMNVPAQPLTTERIAGLPAAQQPAWAAYLERSRQRMATDRGVLAAERNSLATIPASPLPSEGHTNMPLDRDAAWYGTPAARSVADNILSFQTPAGGWGKNQDRSGPPRLRGQSYVIDEARVDSASGNFDMPRDASWHYVGTLDNDATIGELRFLARVAVHWPGREGDDFRASFIKGLRYLFDAQYPNGGWPQVWPLEGGYHDAITFNDNAVAAAAMLLDDVAQGGGDFAFVPAALRAQAAESSRRALEVILASQAVIGGHRTIWAQQVDPLSLAPASARNYEMPSLATSETGDLLVFLMRQPQPSPALQQAVRDGVAWLEAHALYGYEWTAANGVRALLPKPGKGPLWARCYNLTTQQPIFGDRDRSIHDTVTELSAERRNGYSWYNGTAQRALRTFRSWNAAH